MSSTHSLSRTKMLEGSNGDQSPDATLRLLGGVVQELASRIDIVWSQHSTDGSVALRLVEASHSLHRAAIALQDDVAIG